MQKARRSSRWSAALAAGSLAGAAFAGCLTAPGGVGSKAAAPSERVATTAGLSNVERGDYVGSDACAGCHREVSDAWRGSPMHRMTRDARGADVRAPFDGRRWAFRGDHVQFDSIGVDRVMRIEAEGAPPVAYRITRVIGGRTREDYAGVDLARGGEEIVLPVSYVFATGAFRYKGYSVMLHERAGLRAGPVWRRTCIFCHNTVPEMDRLLGAFAGPASRANAYQGELVDRWLPAPRQTKYRVTDADGFSRAVAGEVTHLGGALAPSAEPRAVAYEAIEAVRSRFDGASLVEVGIGCEACHGGARAHARDPALHPSLTPTASWLKTELPAPAKRGNENAAAINRVCARCHQVLFSGYPFTWEGGRRNANAGGSHINSGEARDFLLGGCAGAMACTSCHDPHGTDDPKKREALGTPAGNATCTGCHAPLADAETLRAHAHHDPAGAGGACVACHMPKKNMGLDGALTRYHRIGSPTDPERVLGDRPLECALCHQDATVAKLVDTMEAWWKVRYPRPRLEEMYGALGANVMRATLERGKPHEQAVAMSVLGAARAKDAVPLLGNQLLNEYPLVREWSKRALTAILGRCEVDVAADEATIRAQGAACIGRPLGAAVVHEGGRGSDPED